MPAAVLCRLLAQVAALGPVFPRDHRQKERVALVVADALLHLVERFEGGEEEEGEEARVGRSSHREPIVAGVCVETVPQRGARLCGAVARGKVAPLLEGRGGGCRFCGGSRE